MPRSSPAAYVFVNGGCSDVAGVKVHLFDMASELTRACVRLIAGIGGVRVSGGVCVLA